MRTYLYRLNGLVYEAIQLVEINNGNGERALAVFQAELNKWKKPYQIHWTCGEARRGREVILNFFQQTNTLYEGDWVVRDNLGHINTVDKEDFARNYTLLEEEKIPESDMWDFIKI
jgi:hypothetical protein